MKLWLRVAITLALCAALLIFVVDLRDVAQALMRFDPWWAVIAFAALSADRVLMSYKWGLLLAIRGYQVTLVQRLMVYCSAMMWGLALPSTVGADGIRVVLARRFDVRVDDSLATILVERGIGFISALTTALAGLVILRMLLPAGAPHYASIELALLGGIVVLLAGVGALMFSFSTSALDAFVRAVPRRFVNSKPVQLLTRLHEAYRSLASDRAKLATFSVLTLLEQVLMVACYGLVAAALQVEFNALFLFAAVPIAILISRLPVSIDGLGVYEAIFIAIMLLGGVRAEDSLAISLAARALQIAVWLPWWLLLMLKQGGRPVPLPADTQHSSHL